MRMTDSRSRPRFFIPDSLLGDYENVALNIYTLAGAHAYGSPYSAESVLQVPGVYATDAFSIADEGLYIFEWDINGVKVANEFNVSHDTTGDAEPGSLTFYYEAPDYATGLTDIVLDVYDAEDDYALVYEGVETTEHAQITGIYAADAVSLTESTYLLHWRKEDANPNYRAADAVRVYKAPQRYTVAATVTEDGVAVEDVDCLLLDDSDEAYALGRTDGRGKVVFQVGRASYTLCLRKGSLVFDTNNIAVDASDGVDVVMSISVSTITTPTSQITLGSADLVTLSWTAYELDGTPSRDKFVIESLGDVVGSYVVVQDTMVVTPDEAGQVSVDVPKNIRLRIYAPNGNPRTITASVDGNPFSGYAGATVGTFTPASALPTLSPRSV